VEGGYRRVFVLEMWQRCGSLK